MADYESDHKKVINWIWDKIPKKIRKPLAGIIVIIGVGTAINSFLDLFSKSDKNEQPVTSTEEQLSGSINTDTSSLEKSEEESVLGRYTKTEWENIRNTASKLSVSSSEENYYIHFTQGNQVVCEYDSVSEGYVYLRFGFDYFVSPNVVWLVTVADENGNTLYKTGLAGQMNEDEKSISNIPVPIGKTYITFDLIEEKYRDADLRFQLFYSVGKFK